MSTPIHFLTGGGLEPEAGPPHATVQGFPTKFALQRGPGMGPETQPRHLSQSHECQPCALALVFSPEEGESFSSLIHPEGPPSVAVGSREC